MSSVLFSTHPLFLEHLTGPAHPERPGRLDAVIAGAHHASVADALVAVEPRPATREHLRRVHPDWYLDRLTAVGEGGGGWIDADTRMSPRSADAAAMAAGAGLSVVERLRAGHGDAGFCAVRPPGHHATRVDAMGFCLVSNIAVVAADLVASGERVWIFDYDAHHGNGTQDVFYDDARVLFVSTHQWPLYPGTGRLTERGVGAGEGSTLNVPLPAGATGDVYIEAFDTVIAPVVERFAPTWLLISAGFDAHRDDPIADLGLSAADFGALTRRAMEHVPAGRRLAMLEGGYDLDALSMSSAAVLGALAGQIVAPEAGTSGGPGHDAVVRIRETWGVSA